MLNPKTAARQWPRRFKASGKRKVSAGFEPYVKEFKEQTLKESYLHPENLALKMAGIRMASKKNRFWAIIKNKFFTGRTVAA